MAVRLGVRYWVSCLLCAYYNGDARFSTIGYLGMFIGTFIVYYNLLRRGAFSLEYFTRLLKTLILVYGVVLILQQAALLVGLRNFPPLNLCSQSWLSLTKLPILTQEPSSSARILTVAMLGYWRCLELRDGKKPTIKQLFNKENKRVTLLFAWAMLTMGSGTAFIGIGILSLYFIQARTCIYIIPLICTLFFVGNQMGLQQMERASRVSQAVMRGADKEQVMETDGSAAVRVMPLLNTLTIDLSKPESWFGKGTTKHEDWLRTLYSRKISVVEEYGLLTLFVSLFMTFTCMIKKFFSLETLIFLLLFGFSLGNISYVWGAMLIYAGVCYFQERPRSFLRTHP